MKSIMWVEKYRPKTAAEVIGNEDAKASFIKWLRSKRRKKAVLLYGPAGIGKTALVHAVARDFKFNVVELNASDTRTRKGIAKIAGPTTSFSSLDKFFLDIKENLLLLDEIDGINGREDRGGVSAIVKIIQESQVPIVLTANTIDILKLRPVLKKCLLIRFRRIRIPLIVAFLEKICRVENIVAETDALASLLLPPLNPDRPALVGQLHSREVASEAKLTLMNLYPPDHPVALLRRAGTAQEEVRSLPLYQLDRDAELDEWTALYLPPLARPSSLAELQETMARLRAPDGCPWDREQTPQSLRHNLLEETYEVLEAIDEDDGIKLKEELGDLLMQIVLQVQIAAEGGEFTMAEVAEGIIAKLKSRHPHVFADLSLADSREVLQHWERTKAEERGGKGSPLADLPLALPALARAQAMQGRAATVGFDWQDVGGVVDKVIEEVRELKGARDEERATQELGDLLFSLVNLARWLNLDAESALRQANQRFFQRFTDR